MGYIWGIAGVVRVWFLGLVCGFQVWFVGFGFGLGGFGFGLWFSGFGCGSRGVWGAVRGVSAVGVHCVVLVCGVSLQLASLMPSTGFVGCVEAIGCVNPSVALML